MRWVAATAFVAVIAAALYVVPDGWPDHHKAAWTVGLLILYFACGLFVRGWWAVVLAFLPVVLAVPLGAQGDADGTPLWWWLLIDTGVIFVWVMLGGVLVAWTARAWRRRHPKAGGGSLSPQ
jgi:hypothetical protein